MIKFLCYQFVRCVLKLRYRIFFKDSNFLLEDPLKSTLFLANHVSEVDPVIFVSLLWKRFQPRALSSSYLFKIPLVGFFLNLTRAIPVPEVTPGGNGEKKLESVRCYYDNVIKALNHGDNVLLYPSGKLSRNGREDFREQSSAFILLQGALDTNVVLIRSRGLWGSSFSRALTNSTPDLKKGALQVLKILFRNFIFFLPKRTVEVEVKIVPRKEIAEFYDKKSLNAFLESWLNKDDENEPLNLVPYK